MRINTLIFCAVLFLSVSAYAGQLENGQAAYARGDYQSALKLWQPLADKGDAEAQLEIGDLYLGTPTTKRDYVVAVNWFRKAAEQGNANAQLNMGIAYERGLGVPQNDKTSAEWYRKAAKQGVRQLALLDPSNRSCDDWIKHRYAGGDEPNADIAWLYGFFSGYDIFNESRHGLFLSYDGKNILPWIDKYCADDPKQHIAEAALKFINSFKTLPRN